MKEIETAIGYDKKKPTGNRDKRNEIKRRAKLGSPVPWQELYVNTPKNKSRKPKGKRKNKPISRVITPSVLGGDDIHLTDYDDPRQPLMDWLQSDKNPYFAQAFVNRVWHNYFGKGIVNPVDDMNLANPPSNKPLMEYLAKGFIESGYNMKWLHRKILNSDAYQRSWKPNETNKNDKTNFSKMAIRRLPAEVVADAINQATATKSRILDLTSSSINRTIGPDAMNRKNKSVTSMTYALNVFGKPERTENCDCERSDDPTLLQAIFTRNDPSLNSMVEGDNRRKPGWIAELKKLYSSNHSITSKNKKQLRKLYEYRKKIVSGAPKKPKNILNKIAMKKYSTARKTHLEKLRKINRAISRFNGNKNTKSATKTITSRDLDQLISETFLRTVSRFPTALERAKATTDINKAKNEIDGIKELLWVMLNTKEFLVNH